MTPTQVPKMVPMIGYMIMRSVGVLVFNSENKRVHVSLSISLFVLEDSFREAVLENPNNVKWGRGST